MPRRWPRAPGLPEGIRKFWSCRRHEFEGGQPEYRKHLFLRGAACQQKQRPAFDLARAQEVVEQEKGELSLQERLQCRIRYFSDGVILGSRSFVESHFQRLKQKIGYKRKSGPTSLKILAPAASGSFAICESGHSAKNCPDFHSPTAQGKPAKPMRSVNRHRCFLRSIRDASDLPLSRNVP